MTQLLIRLFIRHPNSPQAPRVRAAYGNLASVVGMVCNILLCLGKFVVGTLFGSIAITADALNNLSDASSNIVSLVGFKLAAKAPDAEHPYGHARFEYLAGLVVSVTILGIGFSLLKESVTKVLHPTPVQFGWLTVAVLVVSILVKLWMSGFNRARRRQPQRCAEHCRSAGGCHPLSGDRLGRAGWPDGRGRGSVHPDLRLGAGDGYPEPAVGRKPQRGSCGAYRTDCDELSRRAGRT